MPHLSPPLAARASQRWGIVTSEELLRDGFQRSSIRRLVQAGVLIRVHVAIFRVATSPDCLESRCAAASLADPESVVTGPAAARLWRFRHVFIPELPEILVSHDRTPITGGVTLRRTNVLEAEDVVVRADGIRVASPPRTWFDCARHLDDTRFEKLTEWVLDHHAQMPTLWRTTRRLEARGRDGLARVRRVLSLRGDWQRPAGSGLEVDVLRALERRGIGPLVRQHPLRLPNGTVIHPDGADVELRWAVEIDHVTWHGGRFEAQRDKARDRQARRLGWQVDRVTDQELKESFEDCIDELVELHALRARQLGHVA